VEENVKQYYRGAFWGRGGASARSAVGAISVTLLLVALVGSSGMGAGAATRAPKVIRAPFLNAFKVETHDVTVAGCGVAKAPAPTFSLRTGNGTLSDSARVTASCSLSPSGNSGEASNVIGITKRLPQLSGMHTIYVNWTIRASGDENITLGRCTITGTSYNSGCYQDAETELIGEAILVDQTSSQDFFANSSWPGATNQTYLTNDVAATYNSSGPINQSFSITTNATFVLTDNFTPGDSYALVSVLNGFTEAEDFVQNAALSPGAQARASLSVSGTGHGFTLVSFTIV
jgi:hypothetical protein